MSHPEGFSDSEHIVIRNNEAFFYYSGNSYKERLKNGTSLEYMFQIENNNVVTNKIETFNNPIKTTINVKHYNINDKYDVLDKKLKPKKKEKKTTKPYNKNKPKPYKKNTIRQKGYDYKLFTIIKQDDCVHIDDMLLKFKYLIDDDIHQNQEDDLAYNDAFDGPWMNSFC